MKHIATQRYGYLVQITRRKIRFSAFVPFSRPDALEYAIKTRDHFLKVAGPMGHPKRKRPHRTGHSNTGIPGISELTTWSGGRAYPCFTVRSAKGAFRFRYRDLTTREQALKKALSLRLQIVEAYHG